MGKTKIDSYLKRRMLTDNGWIYFCRLCGDYKPESDFYKSKHTHFGITYKCKLHYGKDKSNETPEDDDIVSYLKLQKISDSDFEQTQVVLEKLGYRFGPNELPVWKQFEIKHNL
jgi:hypothetical protein